MGQTKKPLFQRFTKVWSDGSSSTLSNQFGCIRLFDAIRRGCNLRASQLCRWELHTTSPNHCWAVFGSKWHHQPRCNSKSNFYLCERSTCSQACECVWTQGHETARHRWDLKSHPPCCAGGGGHYTCVVALTHDGDTKRQKVPGWQWSARCISQFICRRLAVDFWDSSSLSFFFKKKALANTRLTTISTVPFPTSKCLLLPLLQLRCAMSYCERGAEAATHHMWQQYSGCAAPLLFQITALILRKATAPGD